MSVLYIKEQGSYLKKIGERLVVEKGRKTLLDIPVAQVENIAVIGNVQITSQLLYYLMERGVDISYFSYAGKYLGQTAADASKNIFLRFSQYGLYEDIKRRLAIAKIIVKNKVENQIAVLEKGRGNIRKQGKMEDYDFVADLKRMREIVSTLQNKKTPNEVLGVEGICSQIYFGGYGKLFQCDCVFNGRNRRPPRDPINVIISLGYTLLTKEVSSALDAESFEMYLGFLHGIRYGRKSLPLDIVEEFRQPVIDRLALRLFNKRMITENDFENENDQILLTEDGFKKFCREYEKWMNDGTVTGREKSFRSLIRKQSHALKEAVLQEKDYVPYAWESKRGNAD